MRTGSFLLAAVCVGAAATPDDAVIAWMLAQSPGASRHAHVLHRATADGQHDVVVAISYPASWTTPTDGSGWWEKTSTLGIVSQRRGAPDQVRRIVLQPGTQESGACNATVERATEDAVTLLCSPEKGGPGPNHRFTYGTTSAHIEYMPFVAQGIRLRNGRPVIASSDGTRTVEVTYNIADNGFLVRQSSAPWTSAPKATHTLPPLPQSTYDEFSRARPLRVSNGYTRRVAQMNESIGPTQLANGTLWFGKTFYDSEGQTGVGGFGYFDASQKRYQLYSPEAMRDYSATAILVEDDTIWIGLVVNGEWGGSSGGLLRYTRATGQAERIRMKEIVREIARSGDDLLLATSTGISVIRKGTLRRFLIEPVGAGQWQAVEALPATAR